MKNKILKIIGLNVFIIAFLININLNEKKDNYNLMFDKIAMISQANASSEDCNETNYPYMGLRYCGASMTWACITTHSAASCDMNKAECCKD